MLTKRVINLTALALLLSLAETFIPRPLPFFRLGLANIVLLLALGKLGAKEYFSLVLLKAVSTSYISGTLLSPFFLISLSQSLASGLVMYILKALLKNRISLYGLSMAGAALSALTQMFMASLFLGEGLLNLLFLMLIFSFLASLVTAYLAVHIPFDMEKEVLLEKEETHWEKTLTLTLFLMILIVMLLDNLLLLLLSFLLMVYVSHKLKRRFKAGNYITLMVISIISSILVPRGKTLITLLHFPITELSLIQGLRQGLHLSLIVIISLTFSRFLFQGGPVSLILKRFFMMETSFYKAKGGLKHRLLCALNTDDVNEIQNRPVKVPYFTSIMVLCVFIAFKIMEWKVL